jgi:hypothetical protein
MLVDRIRVHGFINIISADEVVIIPCDLQNAAAGVMLFQNWLAHASNKVRDNNTRCDAEASPAPRASAAEFAEFELICRRKLPTPQHRDVASTDRTTLLTANQSASLETHITV